MPGSGPFFLGDGEGGIGRIPWWLTLLGALFLAALLYLVFSSLTRPTPPTYRVSAAGPEAVGEALVRDRTVTLDARDPDRWVRFDFSRGTTAPDSVREWDLAVRRFRMIVNGGAGFPGNAGARAMEGAVFDSVAEVPAGGYRPTLGGEGSDPEHPVLDDWYRYDFFSHLLMPRETPFAIRTADGRYAVMEVLSYYCPGPEPGCFTFRYHYQGNGSRRMAPVK